MARIRPMPSPVELRTFIADHFDRSELGELCADYFPDFYRDYKDNQIKLSVLARELVEHCQHREIISNLIAAVHAKRSEPYESAFGRPPRTEVKTKPRDPQQVFLSYAYEDGELACRLADDLRAAGLRVWIAPESIQPGETFSKAIDRGLRESGIFIVLLSPDAASSLWVEDEIHVAIGFKNQGVMRLFPAQSRSCSLDAFPAALTRLQLTDFVKNYDHGRGALFTQLGVKPIAPLPDELADAIADKRAFVRKGAVDELATLLKGRNTALAEAARIALRQLAKDDSRSVSDAAQAALSSQPTPAPVPPPQPTPLPKTLTITAPLRIDFVLVPAGPFLMGSDKAKDKQAYDAELQQHSVTLPDYYIGKTPVTNGQFEAFVKASGYQAKIENRSGRENHPVVNVTWHDSLAFCAWLSQASGRTIALPSEAEWEKSARSTDGRIYPWGNEAPTNKLCNFNSNIGDTTPVGRYSPAGDSPYGCVDMAGNVWEWTRSLWGKDINKPEFAYPYTQRMTEREDLNAGVDVRRVLRGGSWSLSSQHVRAAFRSRFNPLNRYFNFGFRVVCAPVLPPR